MLVAEESSSPIDVVLRVAFSPGLQQLTFAALSAGDEPRAASVHRVHDTSRHRERVLVLKLHPTRKKKLISECVCQKTKIHAYTRTKQAHIAQAKQ